MKNKELVEEIYTQLKIRQQAKQAGMIEWSKLARKYGKKPVDVRQIVHNILNKMTKVRKSIDKV